ncbi:MAG TPA: hypothetical protein VGI99_01550 [Gemmataceae bacterium]
MRWKWVARATCLAPMLGGCVGVYHPHDSLLAERGVVQSEQEISRMIHRRAREAWQEVCRQYSRRPFTPEFHDGFLDGYSDYLDRGGDGQPPAVPPPRYTQNKHYYSPEGHVRLRDYLLGFKYGTDVAIASGQRQYLTVPVLIPDAPEATLVEAAPEASPITPAPTLPLPMPRAVGESPRPAEVLGPLDPPVIPSVPAMPPLPSVPELPAIPNGSSKASDSSEVKPASADEPVRPPNRDEFEPLPPNLTLPPLTPRPVNHPEPMPK